MKQQVDLHDVFGQCVLDQRFSNPFAEIDNKKLIEIGGLPKNA